MIEDRADMNLTVNGTERTVNIDPDTPLLQVLRNTLGLTGSKFGCGMEQCRACVVLVDGAETMTCRAPVESFVGRDIVTIEGLGAGDLHSIQRAFLEEEAGQCGYCIPGMIIACAALMDRDPQPSFDEVLATLDPHLCRCGSHWRIIQAFRRATGCGGGRGDDRTH
jgi:nicotinate dehydrogenase subunit A